MKSNFNFHFLSSTIGLVIVLLFVISGCSDDSSTNSNSTQGDLKIYMVDSPGDFDAVNVVVTEVSIHHTTGDQASGAKGFNQVPKCVLEIHQILS